MANPYNDETKFTIARLIGNQSKFITNKWYKGDKGTLYFYFNKLGYCHILRPKKDCLFGNIFYEIIDYLLTPENTMDEKDRYGNFNSENDMNEFIKQNMGVA